MRVGEEFKREGNHHQLARDLNGVGAVELDLSKGQEPRSEVSLDGKEERGREGVREGLIESNAERFEFNVLIAEAVDEDKRRDAPKGFVNELYRVSSTRG